MLVLLLVVVHRRCILSRHTAGFASGGTAFDRCASSGVRRDFYDDCASGCNDQGSKCNRPANPYFL